MKIMYEKGDKVIAKNDVLGRDVVVTICEVDREAFADGSEPYKITDGENYDWVYDTDIEPATVSLLTQMNEVEVTEYRKKMLEEDNKKCLEFLVNNPGEYFSSEEIYKNAKISFTSLETLERSLVCQSKLPFWASEELGYEVSYELKPNKKKYYGDDGTVLLRGKSEYYFNAVKKVKEEERDGDE